jgi:hypothetical protein
MNDREINLSSYDQFDPSTWGDPPADSRTEVEIGIDDYEERIKNLRRGILPDSIVDKQFDEFEQNQVGDPFKAVRRTSRFFQNYYENQTTIENLEENRRARQFIRSSAKRFIESSDFIYGKTNRLYGAQTEFQPLLSGYSPTSGGQYYNDPVLNSSKTIPKYKLSSGFVSRAGLEEFTRMFASGDIVKVSMFQFQQENILAQMVQQKNTSWEVATQRLTFDHLSSKGTALGNLGINGEALRAEQSQIKEKISILGGNELSLEISNLLSDQNRSSMYGVRSIGSFHPKVGYVTSTGAEEGDGSLMTFLGSQNITPTLNTRNTVETMLMFDDSIYDLAVIEGMTKRDSPFFVPGVTREEQERLLMIRRGQIGSAGIAKQIRGLTDEILSMTREINASQRYIRPGELYQRIRNKGFNNIYADQSILPRMSKILGSAYHNSKDTVVISGGELSLLFSENSYLNKDYQSLKKSALGLASEGRLLIVTQSSMFQKIQKQHSRKSSKLFDILTAQGNFRLASQSTLHEKSTAVFNQSGQLRSLTVGSANYSEFAMLPLRNLFKRGGVVGQIKKKLFNKIFKESSSADLKDMKLGTLNTEVMLSLGTGIYSASGLEDDEGDQDILQMYDSKGAVEKHYSTLLGAKDMKQSSLLASNAFLNKGLISERRTTPGVSTSPEEIRGLKSDITNFMKTVSSNSLKNSVQIAERYGVVKSGGIDVVGLKIKINPKTSLGLHSVEVNLTVNEEGSVILSDSNRVITGSLYVNQSNIQRRTTSGKTLKQGESAVLSGRETAVSLIYTVAETLQKRAEYGLVDDSLRTIVESRGTKDIETFLAKTISDGLVIGGKSNQNLSLTDISDLLTQDKYRSTVLEAMTVARDRLITGIYGLSSRTYNNVSRMSPEAKARRAAAISNVFDLLMDDSLISRGLNEYRAAIRFQEDLLYQHGGEIDSEAFNDIKAAIVSQDNFQSMRMRAAAKSQSKVLMTLLTSPFLQPHGLGHSGVQAAARLPVFGDYGEDRPDSDIGILNPLNVKASTSLGKGTEGKFLRLIGAVTYGDRMNVPGFLGIRELRTIDSGLNAGAVSVYDTEKIGRGLSGLGYLSKKEMYESFKRIEAIAKSVGLPLRTAKQMFVNFARQYSYKDEDLKTGLLFTPYNKLEQVVQRFKNAMGSRTTFDVNMNLISKLRNLRDAGSVVQELETSGLSQGRLLNYLPGDLHEHVREEIKAFKKANGRSPTLEEIENIYRLRDLDPYSVNRGFIGTSSLRRVAMSAGISLMGDFSYLNPDFKQVYGATSVMSVKYSASSASDSLSTRYKLASMFEQGTFILGRATAVGEAESRAYGFINPEDALARSTEEFLTERLNVLQEEGFEGVSKKFYESFFVGKDKNGRVSLMMREGLYTRDGDLYLRAGDLDDSGRVATVSIGRDLPTGRVHEKLSIGFSGFTHRYEDGITFIYGKPTESQQGNTVSLQVDAVTFKTAQSGSRGAGKAELIKGPFQMLSSNLWNYIDGVLDNNAESSNHRTLLPSYVQEDLKSRPSERTTKSQIYGMYSFNTFKGFSYAAGMSMVSDTVARNNLKNASGLEIAKSLSLAFMEDDEDGSLKRSLINKLRDEGSTHLAESVRISDTKDYTKLGMGMISMGLNAFGDVKFLVKEALQTQDGRKAGIAQDKLAEVYNALLKSSIDTAIMLESQDGTKTYTLNENDPIVKTAAFVSNLIFVGRQVFNPDLKHAGSSDSTLADIGKLATRVDEYITNQGFRTRVGVLADRMRIELPRLEDLQKGNGRHSLLKSLRRMDAVLEHNYLIEYVIDTSISRSLTPTGSKDDVPLEYQYLVSAPADYFRRFQSRYGKGVDRAKEIQNTYGMLMTSGFLGNPKSSGLEYRIALPAPAGVNASEAAKRGFINSQLDYTNRYASSFISLGIEFQTLQQMEIANRLAVSSYGRDEELLKERASAIQNLGSNNPGSETIIDLPFLNFVDDFNTDSIGRAQQQMIKRYFVGTGKENSDRVMSMVVDGYTRAAKSYYESKAQGDGITFTEFINSEGMYSDEGSDGIRGLELRFKIAEQLESASGFFKPIATKVKEKEDGQKRYYFDEDATAKNLRAAILRKSRSSVEKLRENNNLQSEERFMKGLYDLEERIVSDMELIKKYGESYKTVDRRVLPLEDQEPLSYSYLQDMLSEVQSAKQVVLPAFEGFLDPETNKINVQFYSVQDKAPTQGILYGTSEIRNLALSFPGFQSNYLKNQMIARQKLALYGGVDGLLSKVANGGQLSQAEFTELQELEKLIEQTGQDPATFAETNIIRKAHGDQMGFKGFVGIAVNSLALDANQMILGERSRSTSRNLHGLAVINNQTRRLQNATQGTNFEHELESLKTMLRLYGTDDQDYLTQAEMSEDNKIATTTDIEEVARRLNSLAADRSMLPTRKERNEQQVAEAKSLTDAIKLSKRELQVKIYSFATGVSEQVINKENNLSKLRRMINMPEGAVRRSGAPSLSTMHTNAQNIYQVLMPNQYNEILRSNNSMLEIDVAQSETAMILPTVGRLLTMLGDFDGDSYQFISTTSGYHLSEVNAIDQKIKNISDRIRFKSRGLSGSDNRNPENKITINTDLVTEEIRHLTDELRHYESEREDLLGILSGYGGGGFFARQQAMLNDVKEWSGNFLALPKFMTQEGGEGSLTNAEALGMVQWMRVLFPSLDDNEQTLDAAKKNSKLVGNMVTRAFSGGFLDKSQIKGGEMRRHEADTLMQKMNEDPKEENHISKDDADLIISLRNDLALDPDSMSPQEIKDKIDNWYIGKVASTSVMFNTFNKTVGRAAGSVLSGKEQDSLQNIFGEAGSKLIGQVYNSFSPLIDSAIKANSMDYMLQSKDYRSTLHSALSSIAGSSDGEQSVAAMNVIKKLGLAEDKESAASRDLAREEYRSQFFGVTSTLGTLQQSVRDALKFKTDQGLREMLKSEDISGRLAEVEGKTESEKNRKRSTILRQFIMEKMGPQIAVDPKSSFADTLGSVTLGGERYVKHDMGFSGFGAMLSLYEFSQTSNDRLGELFGENSMYQELYDEVSEKTGMDKSRLVAEVLSDMVQKTQASFIVDTLKGETGNFVRKSLEFYDANNGNTSLNEYDQQIIDLTRKYKEEQSKLADEGKLKNTVRLQQDFMHAMILTEIRSRPGFDAETVLKLREQNQVTLAYRSGDSEFFETETDKKMNHMHMVTVANRRGQQPSLKDQTLIMLDTLETAEYYKNNMDGDMSSKAYAQAMSLLSVDLPGGPLSDIEKDVLARATVQEVQSPDLSTGTGSRSALDVMKKSSTAINQMLSILDVQSEISSEMLGTIGPDGSISDTQLERYEFLNQTIDDHIKRDAEINNNVNRTYNVLSDDIDVEIDKAIRMQHDTVSKKMSEENNNSILKHDPKMEIIGALIAPLALGMMSQMPDFGDRLATTFIDVTQSVAHMNTVDSRLTTRMLAEEQRVSQVARYAQASRIKDLSRQEGVVIGGIQGSLQEMLFRQTSQMAYKAIDYGLGKTNTGKMTGMRAGGIMAAETISTTLSLVLSKNISAAAVNLSPVENVLPDFASEMLSEFTDYIWKMAEENLLSGLQEQDLEVMSAEVNDSMDFSYSAIPNELSADLDSGMLVIDEQGERMQTIYEGDEFVSMISGASSINIGSETALSSSAYS